MLMILAYLLKHLLLVQLGTRPTITGSIVDIKHSQRVICVDLHHSREHPLKQHPL